MLMNKSIPMALSTLFVKDPVLIADLEMLLMGGYAPLTTYLGSKDYHSVLENMRLVTQGGKLWPLPICLGVTKEESLKYKDWGDHSSCRFQCTPIGRLDLGRNV